MPCGSASEQLLSSLLAQLQGSPGVPVARHLGRRAVAFYDVKCDPGYQCVSKIGDFGKDHDGTFSKGDDEVVEKRYDGAYEVGCPARGVSSHPGECTDVGKGAEFFCWSHNRFEAGPDAPCREEGSRKCLCARVVPLTGDAANKEVPDQASNVKEGNDLVSGEWDVEKNSALKCRECAQHDHNSADCISCAPKCDYGTKNLDGLKITGCFDAEKRSFDPAVLAKQKAAKAEAEASAGKPKGTALEDIGTPDKEGAKAEGAKTEGAKEEEGAKAEGAKTEGAKEEAHESQEGAKAEGAKTEGAKEEAPPDGEAPHHLPRTRAAVEEHAAKEHGHTDHEGEKAEGDKEEGSKDEEKGHEGQDGEKAEGDKTEGSKEQEADEKDEANDAAEDDAEDAAEKQAKAEKEKAAEGKEGPAEEEYIPAPLPELEKKRLTIVPHYRIWNPQEYTSPGNTKEPHASEGGFFKGDKLPWETKERWLSKKAWMEEYPEAAGRVQLILDRIYEMAEKGDFRQVPCPATGGKDVGLAQLILGTEAAQKYCNEMQATAATLSKSLKFSEKSDGAIVHCVQGAGGRCVRLNCYTENFKMEQALEKMKTRMERQCQEVDKLLDWEEGLNGAAPPSSTERQTAGALDPVILKAEGKEMPSESNFEDVGPGGLLMALAAEAERSTRGHLSRQPTRFREFLCAARS